MTTARPSSPRWPAMLLLVIWIGFVLLVGIGWALSMPTGVRIALWATTIVIGTPLLIATAESARIVFQDLSAWLEGDRVVAPLSHGLGVSIAAFIAAIVAHPKVTAKDATAWPKPLRS
ncbi:MULTISPECIES: hypothetical protein [Nocardiaceae]|uniref:hypothetical protein n=1 Tax=Nocardiaceae TaxID=85025 RepID=UPI00113FE7BA|nr:MULTISPECIES: hypothetical protein [Rhodococcus]